MKINRANKSKILTLRHGAHEEEKRTETRGHGEIFLVMKILFLHHIFVWSVKNIFNGERILETVLSVRLKIRIIPPYGGFENKFLGVLR